MKNYRGMAGLMPLALLVAGYLIPTAAKAKDAGESAQITQLLADSKAEAVELKTDSDYLEAISTSKLSWGSYARRIEMIKEHVNNTGKLLAKLQDAAPAGSPWQQTAIQRIDGLLRELAANTEATINLLNENRSKIPFTEFRDYAKANYELATDLEALVHDFVNYGEVKAKAERLGAKREIPD